MGLLDFMKSKKPKEESPSRQLMELMQKMSEGGCETDEIPGSYGEFGYDITNPIPTYTIPGSYRYLDSLRLLDGMEVTYERQGSCSAPNISQIIDRYVISHPDGRQLGFLYLSPYHKRTSEKAPRGFKLA